MQGIRGRNYIEANLIWKVGTFVAVLKALPFCSDFLSSSSKSKLQEAQVIRGLILMSTCSRYGSQTSQATILLHSKRLYNMLKRKERCQGAPAAVATFLNQKRAAAVRGAKENQPHAAAADRLGSGLTVLWWKRSTVFVQRFPARRIAALRYSYCFVGWHPQI